LSGPALRERESHSSIHEAALGEAEELTDMLAGCLAKNERDKALEVACIAVEHWESRTLRHAEAEESGLYKEIAETTPEHREAIIALTRDHAIMRSLIGDIKLLLAKGGVGRPVLQRFEALILVDKLHNRDEEKLIGHDIHNFPKVRRG
jgi:hypothetical protein